MYQGSAGSGMDGKGHPELPMGREEEIEPCCPPGWKRGRSSETRGWFWRNEARPKLKSGAAVKAIDCVVTLECEALRNDPNLHNCSSAGSFCYPNRQREEEESRDEGWCCSSSQKGKVFLSHNLCVYLVVLFASTDTRFSRLRWDLKWMVVVSLAALYFCLGHCSTTFTCPLGQVDKKKHLTPASLFRSN